MQSALVDGDWLALGTPGDSAKGTDAGSVALFARSPDGKWLFKTRMYGLKTDKGDRFGASVAIDKERLVVGAPGAGEVVTNIGTIHVFELTGTGIWEQTAKLYPASSGIVERFGAAVAVDGPRIVGLSAKNDPPDWVEDTGPIQTRSILHNLVARPCEKGRSPYAVGKPSLLGLGARPAPPKNKKGPSRVLSGLVRTWFGPEDTPFRIFERRPAGTWKQTMKGSADGLFSDEGAGTSVDIAAGRMVIGAPRFSLTGQEEGGAFIYEEQPGGAWKVTAYLLDLAARLHDELGADVALLGDQVAVAVPNRSAAGSKR